jgi:hypothetical protein
MKNRDITNQPIDINSKVSISDSVLFRKLDEESVLLNLDNEMYYGLDKVGTSMWVALESSESISLAHRQLLAEYDVDSDQLQSDLIELVRSLLEHKLIIVSDM